jgi:glycopeptide antibiotics resistance protein
MVIFERYWNNLLYHVPDEFLVASISFLTIGVIVSFIWNRWREALMVIAKLLLIDMLFILYSSTLVFRKASINYDFNFTPLWSYKAILEGKTELLLENVMNILVFVPIGLLLSLSINKRTWIRVIGGGGAISVSIETMQFLFKRGFSELDDVIHNLIGCIFGYIIFLLICKSKKYLTNIVRVKTT